MNTTRLAATFASAALLSSLVGGTSAAFAQTACDAYSGGCASPAPTVGTDGGDGDGDNGGGDTDGGTAGGGSGSNGGAGEGGGSLPFTGGEVVLLTTVGLGAVGAGSVLLLAGRRRRTA